MSALTRSERKAYALIDQWFVDELAPRQWRFLRANMGTSRAVRAYYDRVAAARAVVRPSEVLSADRMRAIEEAVLPKPRRASRVGYIWAFAAAAVAMVALVVVRPVSEDLAPRATAPAQASIRAYCIADSTVHTVASADAAGVCALGDALQLTYAIADDAPYRYLFVFGLDEARTPLWYFPSPDERTSLAVAGRGEHVLPDSIALAVNHRPGRVTIYGIFSSAPVSIEDVQGWLSQSLPTERAGMFIDTVVLTLNR
jgi:hypothetical protein